MGTYQADAATKAAQRDFDDNTAPTWELQPGEQVCTACHLVHRGDCW